MGKRHGVLEWQSTSHTLPWAGNTLLHFHSEVKIVHRRQMLCHWEESEKKNMTRITMFQFIHHFFSSCGYCMYMMPVIVSNNFFCFWCTTVNFCESFGECLLMKGCLNREWNTSLGNVTSQISSWNHFWISKWEVWKIPWSKPTFPGYFQEWHDTEEWPFNKNFYFTSWFYICQLHPSLCIVPL